MSDSDNNIFTIESKEANLRADYTCSLSIGFFNLKYRIYEIGSPTPEKWILDEKMFSLDIHSTVMDYVPDTDFKTTATEHFMEYLKTLPQSQQASFGELLLPHRSPPTLQAQPLHQKKAD